MRNYIAQIFALTGMVDLIGAIVWVAVLPLLDWGADRTPPAIETLLARNVIGQWIHRNAPERANPLSPTVENLRAARSEYQEHCAVCHGLDGSGRNQFEADFYPPIARLAGDAQGLSDGEIYFVVARGIRDTAMPAFGKIHTPDDIWRCVLWVRHMTNLTPEERAAVERQVREATSSHESAMEHSRAE